MLFSRHGLMLCLLLLNAEPTRAQDNGQNAVDAEAARQGAVRRSYSNTSKHLIAGQGIVLVGVPTQVMRISAWLDRIYSVPHGRETLEAILSSGNQLTIRHSAWALEASGRTLAPISDSLTNGCGADVEILFDARIPEQGSHWVFDSDHRRIEFTAVQNLFHELAHAKHLTRGTWRYFDSEAQAIEEENLFRRQFSEHEDGGAPLRAGIEGQQFWWPAD
jgi:hypothetical protein